MRGAHHPRGDRILVRRAELAALQVGQRLQRRIGRHQEVGLVVLEALGHHQQLVVGLLDGLDRQVRRVHQRQVVGLVGQALAQAGVVGHRLDLHRLLQQLAQVGGDGGIARADLLVRHAVGHALVDGEDQVGLGQPADGGQDQRCADAQIGDVHAAHSALARSRPRRRDRPHAALRVVAFFAAGRLGSAAPAVLAPGRAGRGSNSKLTLPSFLS